MTIRVAVATSLAAAGTVAGTSAGAAPSIVLGARPATALALLGGFDLQGRIATGAAGQAVTFEAKECGRYSGYHAVGGTTTLAGGVFSEAPSQAPGVTTSYRARWRGGVSNPVTVRVRPRLDLARSRPRLTLQVWASGIFRGRRARLERLAGDGGWRTVRTFALRGSYADGGYASPRVRLPHGVLVRATLPRRACFLAGVSNTVRT